MTIVEETRVQQLAHRPFHVSVTVVWTDPDESDEPEWMLATVMRERCWVGLALYEALKYFSD